MPSPVSSVSGGPPRTAFRTTLSNIGQAVSTRRFVRRRRSNTGIEVAQQSSRFNSDFGAAQLSRSNASDLESHIRRALVDRTTFESSFQLLMNEILGSDENAAASTVDLLFSVLVDASIALKSKGLALELLDSLVVLDQRCLSHVANHTQGLILMTELATAKITSGHPFPIVLPPRTEENEIRQLTSMSLSVLRHWDGFISESADGLPFNARLIVDAARSCQSGSVDPMGGRVHQNRERPPPIHSRISPLVASSPRSRPSANRVEEQLASTLALIELTNESVRQAQGPGAAEMVADLVQQCDKEQRVLTQMMASAVDGSDYTLFDQIQKVESDLKSTMDSAKSWLNNKSKTTHLPDLRKQSSTPSDSVQPLKVSPLSPASRAGSLSPRTKSKRSEKHHKSKSSGTPPPPPQIDSNVQDDFSNPFPSDPFAPQPLSSQWPPPPTEAPPTPLAAVATDDGFFSSATWTVDFPNTPPAQDLLSPTTRNDAASPRSQPSLIANDTIGNESMESSERPRRKKKNRQKDNSQQPKQNDSQESSDLREDDFPEFASAGAAVDKLKEKIKRLELRLEAAEIQPRPDVENEIRSQLTAEFNRKISLLQAAHDALRKELGDVRLSLQQKEEELEGVRKDVKKKAHEIDRLQYDLTDREQAVSHAKDMWMRETSRATAVADTLDEVERKLLDKEMQLATLAKKYQDISRETAALKNLVKEELDEFNSPSRLRPSLFSSVPPETANRLRASAHPRDEPVQFFSLEQAWAPQKQKPPMKTEKRDREWMESTRPTPTKPLSVESPKSFTKPFASAGDPFGRSQLEWHDADPDVCYLLNSDELETLSRFRTLLSCNDEVLYEDLTLQLGVKAQYRGLTGALQLYIGNMSVADIQSLSVDVFNSGENALGITHSLIASSIGARQQICQSLVLACSEPFENCPTLRVSYLLPDNSPALLQLALPIPVTKFMEGRHLDYEAFFRFWKHEEFVLREVTNLIHLDKTQFRRSLLLIARAMQLNGALKLLPGVDPVDDNLVLSGVFPSSQSDLNIPTSLVLIRFESGSGKYRDVGRLAVRSDSTILARALRNILSAVVASPTRDSFKQLAG